MTMKKSSGKVQNYNFLLSNWYSGATVLSILLNNHKSITCNGETYPFPDQDTAVLCCSCGQTVDDCDFYKVAGWHFKANGVYDKKYFASIPVISRSQIIQRLFYSYRRAPKLRDLLCNLQPGYKDTINKFIDYHTRFFLQACEFDGSEIYLDGAKSVRRAELFAKYGSKPVRIVHSIRDGRKFVASYMRAYNLSEKDIPFIAKEWVDYIEMVMSLKKRYPGIELMEVRHEDLCHDKIKMITDICEFLGVNYDEDIFEFNDVNYHMLGNEMRHAFNGEVMENDRWKKTYTPESFKWTTSLLQPYLTKYGYLEDCL